MIRAANAKHCAKLLRLAREYANRQESKRMLPKFSARVERMALNRLVVLARATMGWSEHDPDTLG